MADEPAAIPLADVLHAADDLVSAGLIKDCALGGALAPIYSSPLRCGRAAAAVVEVLAAAST